MSDRSDIFFLGILPGMKPTKFSQLNKQEQTVLIESDRDNPLIPNEKHLRAAKNLEGWGFLTSEPRFDEREFSRTQAGDELLGTR